MSVPSQKSLKANDTAHSHGDKYTEHNEDKGESSNKNKKSTSSKNKLSLSNKKYKHRLPLNMITNQNKGIH